MKEVCSNMDFTTFSAVLTIYHHNFKVLHWGAGGKKFDRVHSLSQDYADMCLADLDIIAEMGLRNGQPPVSMGNIIETLKESDGNFMILDYKTYNYKEFCVATTKMLSNILDCIATLRNSDEMQSDANMGIKASLEAMYDKYDLQARYLNARRMSDED